MKTKNKVARVISEARKEKAEVRLNIRLKKDGRFSSVSGKVSEVKVSQDGAPYVVVRPTQKNKHIQSVPFENILAVVKDGEVFKR